MPKDKVKNQIESLEKTILELIRGNFDCRAPVSKEGNEIDALATGINILTEELQATTVSKITLEKYFDEVLNALLAIMNLDFKCQLPVGDTESPLSAISQAVNITSQEVDALISEITSQKDFVENIIKSMIDTLIVVNPDANIKTINKATSDLLGYKEEELIGKPVATIFAEEEEEEEESIFKGARLQKLMEEGSIRDYDMTYRTKSGEKIPVSFSGSVMYEPSASEASFVKREAPDVSRDTFHDSRKIVGIVGIARDMREIKRLMEKEKELAAAAAAAAAAADRKRAAELEAAYKELSEKTERLERFHKVTIGRELDMVKLKEEINTLLEKSGQSKKYESPEKIKQRTQDGDQ